MGATRLVMSERAKAVVAALNCPDAPPITAIQLASAINVKGSHETLRKRVREAVEFARDSGHRICANGSGYWLARNATEWAAYRAARSGGARFAFVRLRKAQEAVVDRIGKQGRLFPG